MDRGKPLPRCPRRCDYHPTCFFSSPQAKSCVFILSILMRLLDYAFLCNADCLASALAATVLAMSSYCHNRRVALPSPSETKTSTVGISIAGTGHGSAEELAIERSKQAVLWLLKRHAGCSENAGSHAEHRIAVILGAVLWLPISFGLQRRCTRYCCQAHVLAGLDATLCIPLATVIAKEQALGATVYRQPGHRPKKIRSFSSWSRAIKTSRACM